MFKKLPVFYAAAVSLALIFSGCSDSKEDPPGGGTGKVYQAKVSGQINPVQAGTRVSTNNDGVAMVWEAGDAIGVYYLPKGDEDGQIINRKFDLNSGAGNAKGEFTSTAKIELSEDATEHVFHAIYPYNQTSGADMTAVPVVLPSELTISGENRLRGYDFLVGSGSYTNPTQTRADINEETVDVDLQFDYPFSVITFTIDAAGTMADDETLDSFTLSSGVPFVGNASYNVAQKSVSAINGTTFDVEFESGKSLSDKVNAYFQVYPVDMTAEGLKLEFITANYDASFTIPVSGKFEPGKAYNVTANLQELIESGNGELEYTGEPLVSANSYIIKPGEVVEIPVARAYEVWKQYLDTEPTGPVTANILWQTERELLTNVRLSKGDRGINSAIRVEAGTSEGNAVVQLSVGGEVRWAYHLWITSVDLEEQAHDWNGYVWMDRNLGALSAERGVYNAPTWGLYYQWGRNYPHPGAVQSTTSGNGTLLPFYDGEGNPLSVTYTAEDSDNNLRFSLQNPLVHIENNTWQGNNGAASWEDNGKTVFDPCPAGWRVPYGEASPWAALSSAGLTSYSTGARGFEIKETGAWYPATGGFFLSGTNWPLQQAGYAVYTWDARHNHSVSEGNRAMHLYYYYSLNTSYSAAKKYGHAVRCVKE